jgi:hypothetical protein
MMGNLLIQPDVIEKCLNHTEENKVKRIYQRQELKLEQAEAWPQKDNLCPEKVNRNKRLKTHYVMQNHTAGALKWAVLMCGVRFIALTMTTYVAVGNSVLPVYGVPKKCG